MTIQKTGRGGRTDIRTAKKRETREKRYLNTRIREIREKGGVSLGSERGDQPTRLETSLTQGAHLEEYDILPLGNREDDP